MTIESNYTIAVCTRDVGNNNICRFMTSYQKIMDPQGFELMVMSTGRGQFENLNMAIEASRTKYFICADDDLEFNELQIGLVDKLDKFWNAQENALGIAAGPNVKTPTICDESIFSCYNNFFMCCLNRNALEEIKKITGNYFDETYKYSQCGDVDLIRTGRYLGKHWFCADFMCPHHHISQSKGEFYENYLKKNQEYMRAKWGCETDALPEIENNWSSFEEWLEMKDDTNCMEKFL